MRIDTIRCRVESRQVSCLMSNIQVELLDANQDLPAFLHLKQPIVNVSRYATSGVLKPVFYSIATHNPANKTSD
jgi:hypothetical protein